MPPDNPSSLNSRTTLRAWCLLLLLLCAIAGLFALPRIAHAAPPSTGNIVAWYRGDSLVNNGSGVATAWNDKGSGGFNLNTSNSPTIVNTGLNNRQALEFNGSNQYAQGADVAAMDGLSAYSVWTVFKTDTIAGGAQELAGKWDGNGFFFEINNGGAGSTDFGSHDSNHVRAESVISAATWTHELVTFDNALGTNKHKIFINGGSDVANPNGSPDTVTGIGANTGLFNIGRLSSGFGRYFDGQIAEVIFWNKALNSSEREALYTYYQNYYVNPPTLSKPPNNLGLVGYWSFNEGTGTQATDFSGNGNTGTLNGPTWTNGKRGKALDFDGTDDSVNMGSTPTSLDITGEITISAWIKLDSFGGSSRGRIVDSAAGTFDGFVFFVDNFNVANGLGFQANTNFTTITGANVVALGEWQHVVVTQRAPFAPEGEVSFYVNGVAVTDDGSILLPPIASSHNFLIGGRASATDRQFDGLIDEVRIYNRALGATEIAKLYGSGAVKLNASSVDLQQGSTLANGLVGHWTFDGPDTGATIADRSGQNNHGYFNGGATSSAKVSGKLGQALNFDGIDDYVQFTDINAMDNLSAFSVAAWVRVGSVGDMPREIAGKWDGANGFFFEMGNTNCASGKTVAFGVDASNWTITSNEVLVSGQWQHVVAVFDNALGTGKHKVYVDGVSQSLSNCGSPDTPTGIGNSSGIFYIGRLSEAFGRYGLGTIDDVRFYNRALSPTEIQQLYKLGTVIIRP